MNSCYYYAFDDKRPAREMNTCSLASEEYPFEVNCAGNLATTFPFTTDNASGREDYYLIYMVTGKMEVSLPEGTRPVEAGNVILFPPHYPYRYVYCDKEPLSYLWVHFTGSYVQKFLTECKLAPLPCIHQTSQNSALPSSFHRIFDIFNAKTFLQKQELACALERLLLAVAKSIVIGTKKHTLERSIRHIHSNYTQKIQIPELAKMEGLCNSRYITLFERYMGMSPSTYIIKLRIQTACDLLQSTDISVKQIGTMVGYNDPQFFSRIFKKECGISPQEFRSDAT